MAPLLRLIVRRVAAVVAPPPRKIILRFPPPLPKSPRRTSTRLRLRIWAPSPSPRRAVIRLLVNGKRADALRAPPVPLPLPPREEEKEQEEEEEEEEVPSSEADCTLSPETNPSNVSPAPASAPPTPAPNHPIRPRLHILTAPRHPSDTPPAPGSVIHPLALAPGLIWDHEAPLTEELEDDVLDLGESGFEIEEGGVLNRNYSHVERRVGEEKIIWSRGEWEERGAEWVLGVLGEQRERRAKRAREREEDGEAEAEEEGRGKRARS